MRNIRVVVILCLIAGGFFYWKTADSHPDRPDVLTQVQKLSQLATVRYTVQRIVTLTEDKHPIGSESIVLIVQARVEAGVDLSSLQQKDVVVSPKGSSVRLTLPRAKILNSAIDEMETKVWDRQKTWWTPWVSYSLDLEKRSRIEGLESAKQAALGMGILAASQANAETAVRSLLELAGIRSVTFGPAP